LSLTKPRWLLGFDNGLKRYQGVWMSDSMTGMMIFDGTADETGKIIIFTGAAMRAFEIAHTRRSA
jgi:hypothetical protein